MCELIDDLAAGPLKRGTDPSYTREALVQSGLWALGLPEHLGGGGADHLTTMMAIRQVSMSWPAMGLGMAQLHAVAPVLTQGSVSAAVLPSVIERGGAVGVVDLAIVGAGADSTRIGRVDTLGADAALLVLRGSEFCVVPAAEVSDRIPLACTGLDGMVSCAATIPKGASWQSAPAGDEIRARFYTGLTAVAAGLVHSCAAHAHAYTQSRIQFGAPLTALPTMQDELLRLRGAADVLGAQAHAGELAAIPAAGVLVAALDTAVDAAARALQCFGGYGYLEEYPAAGLFRDAVSLRAVADAAAVERTAAAALGATSVC